MQTRRTTHDPNKEHPAVNSNAESTDPLAASECFVCGPDNPTGLKLTFLLEGEYCIAAFTPGEFHCGYRGITHGGIIFSALDDVMANWLFLRGERAVTAKCNLRYKTPLPTGIPTQLKSWCLKRKGRLAMMASEIRRKDTLELIAECDATFMVSP
mgnify:FL=1